MDFALALDHHSEISLHQQLYDELRQAILNGRLLPRQKLPSTRLIAQSLGISRTTATQSYDRLPSEGYLDTIVGSGTYVCAQLPDDSDAADFDPPAGASPAINRFPLPIWRNPDANTLHAATRARLADPAFATDALRLPPFQSSSGANCSRVAVALNPLG